MALKSIPVVTPEEATNPAIPATPKNNKKKTEVLNAEGLRIAPLTIDKLAEAIKDKTSEDVELNAHKLKGMLAQIGAKQLQEKARQLEAAGKEKNTEVFDLLYNSIKEDLNKLISFLSKEDWMVTTKQHYNMQPVA